MEDIIKNVRKEKKKEIGRLMTLREVSSELEEEDVSYGETEQESSSLGEETSEDN